MRRILAVACAASFALACSDDGAGPERTVQIVGSYQLQTINDVPLPYPLFSLPGFLLEQASGRFVLNANRTYEEIALVREWTDPGTGPVSRDTTITLRGTWEAEDSVLLVTQTNTGATGFGFVSGDRLTLSFEAGDSLFTYIYLRESPLSSTARLRTTTSSTIGRRSTTVSSTTSSGSALLSRIWP